MKYYEPFQRLNFVYLKAENAVYVKSSVSVLLPAGVTLVGKDPVVSKDDAFLKYFPTIDHSASDPYILDQERLISFMSDITRPTETELKDLKTFVIKKIESYISSFRFFTVVCEVYDNHGVLAEKVSNTIAKDGEVVIL